MYSYDESLVTTDIMAGWVPNSSYELPDPWNGDGHIVYVNNTSGTNVVKVELSSINLGAQSINITDSDPGNVDNGWNLIGNPFLTSINFIEPASISVLSNNAGDFDGSYFQYNHVSGTYTSILNDGTSLQKNGDLAGSLGGQLAAGQAVFCLLYTSPSPRD